MAKNEKQKPYTITKKKRLDFTDFENYKPSLYMSNISKTYLHVQYSSFNQFNQSSFI